MTDEKDGLWVALARVEDSDSPYAKLGHKLITRDMIQQVVKSYDPQFRKASIVAAEKGSVHTEKGLPSVAYIDKLDTDGLNLFGRIEAESVGAFSDRICRGWRDRSVEIYPRMPGIDGEPPYLLRVGMLSSTQPGIPNLPDLKEYVRDLPMEGVQMICRTLDDALVEPQPPAVAPTQETAMTAEETKALAEQIMAGLTPRLDAMEAKVGELQGKVTESVTEVQRSGEKVLEELKARDAKDREKTVKAGVEALVREMRLTPADAEQELVILRELPTETGDKRLEFLRSRAPMSRRPGVEQTLVGNDGTEVVISREFTDPHGNCGANPEAIRAVEKAKTEAAGDPKKLVALLQALPPQLTAN